MQFVVPRDGRAAGVIEKLDFAELLVFGPLTVAATATGSQPDLCTRGFERPLNSSCFQCRPPDIVPSWYLPPRLPAAGPMAQPLAHPFKSQSMKRLSTFLLGMATGALLLHAATMYHVVRASDGVHLVQKQPPRLSETYVDIRQFTMSDWATHPQLASALVQANQQQLLGDSAAGALRETVNQALPAWPKK